MLGKTHMAVGVAATLAITRPDSVGAMILAVGVGAIGAVIPDIDVGTSGSHREVERIIRITMVIITGVFLLEYFFQMDIVSRITANGNVTQAVVGILLFLFICGFGAKQPHRSFMHSFLAMILLSLSLGLVCKLFVPYFAAGFLSHILLDLLNYKRVRLWYPLQGGARLGLCKAGGTVNSILFVAGCIASVGEAGWLLWQMIPR